MKKEKDELLLLLLRHGLHFLDIVIGHLLDVFLNGLVVILGDLGGFLLLLELVDSVPADVPDSHFGFFTVFFHLFGQIFTPFLGELGEHQTDDLAVILGIDA